ncbi:MAG: ABC transporter ATP-binding protein [Firmicutes bacterium]|nr:ABC transporter ATP-binding protein [Sporosalibacterium faouarense]MTI49642.1 ABC transporter ATP-binding protein [Bacillota bacterium]
MIKVENKKVYISVNNIVKSYADKIVNKNINLEIFKGEIYCLAGPNGSGKTTLIRQMMGLEKPDSGTIFIEGDESLKGSKNSKFIGNYVSYQPQNVNGLLRGLKVKEAIYYVGKLKKMQKNKCREEVDRLIDLFQIKYLKDSLVSSLSGGERQLVNLCMTFIGYSPILVFDEPTNNLDVEKREVFIKEIMRCRKECNSTILLITHDLIEFEKVIDRIGIMFNGEILIIDSPSTLCKESNDLIKIILKHSSRLLTKILKEEGYEIFDEKDYNYLIASKKDFNDIFNITQGFINEGVELSVSSINLQDKYFSIINNKGELENA